jgi:hypothetical protein
MATSEIPEWTHHYAAVYQISEAEGPKNEAEGPKKKNEAEGPKKKRELRLFELRVAAGAEIGREGSDLKRVLDTLQDQLLCKPLYLHANNPTSRLLVFRSDDDGRPNRSREQLDLLLAVEDEGEIRAHTWALAKQYLTIPNTRTGVLIFLVSEPPQAGAGRCVFVFKCDFEAISQIDRRHLFHPIDHAIVETTKKAALYPYFSDGRLDPTTVMVFDEQRETQYWLDFLELGVRTPESRSHHQRTVEQLDEKLSEKYVEQLEVPPPVRPLDRKKRFVDEEDRKTPEEVDDIIENVSRGTEDTKVTLRLGEFRLEAPESQYNHTWVIAEEGDERYIVLKGDTLENRTRGLTAIDFASFEGFKEAVRRLGIRCD